MLSIAERHKHILDKLNAQGFVKVLDIARELDVTPVTIRKDLKLLEEKKLLFRTHGSASPVNPHTADINIQRCQTAYRPYSHSSARSERLDYRRLGKHSLCIRRRNYRRSKPDSRHGFAQCLYFAQPFRAHSCDTARRNIA